MGHVKWHGAPKDVTERATFSQERIRTTAPPLAVREAAEMLDAAESQCAITVYSASCGYRGAHQEYDQE